MFIDQSDAALKRIETQIMENGGLIEVLTQSIYQQKSKEQISIMRVQINTLRSELDVLYDEQWVIEKELENEENTMKWCV
jgi:formyltetrahydrofolate synthetase